MNQGLQLKDIVESWFAGGHSMWDVVYDSPEIAWAAILDILAHGLAAEQMALLAGGPLESLLVFHGRDFIQRIEQEAGRGPAFKHWLGGVWQNQMSPEIWERVQKVRTEVC